MTRQSPTMPLLALMLAFLCHSVHAAATDSVNSLLSSSQDIRFGPGVLAAVAIGVGAVMCVAGYRLFRAAIFVCGFIVGGLAVASAIEYFARNESWMDTGSWIGFFVGGLIVGLIAMSLYSLSIFIAGAAGGVLLAFTLHTTVFYKISPDHPNTVLVIVAVILGLLCGILALKLEKPVLIIATSFVGAVAVTWGIGYFAGDFPNAADLKYYSKNLNGDTVISIPTAWWAYLAGIIVLFVLGMYIQFRKTGRGRNYHHYKHHNRAHAVPPSHAEMQTPPANSNPRYGNPVAHV